MTYIVFREEGGDAVIIDPVLNYDPASGEFCSGGCDLLIEFLNAHNLNLHHIVETHAHADHLSGSQYLKEKHPNAILGVGKNITLVQEVFSSLLNLDIPKDGSQFDALFEDSQEVQAGDLSFTVRFTPGHTPACTTLCFDGFVFCGDALFMPDYGAGRCDFPKGSASDLFDSVTEVIFKLSDETVIFVGHDYCPGGRALKFCTTVGESKKSNIRLNSSVDKESFVNFRSTRDATLSTPRLLLPSIQVNINGGHFPKPEANGVSYLKVPVTKKEKRN